MGNDQTTVGLYNTNPNLKWQSDKQTNIGFDFGFLGSKISGSIDYFNKKTADLLFQQIKLVPTVVEMYPRRSI